MPELSILIPCFNEHESLPQLHRELTEALTAIGKPYEILFINDGSSDGTDKVLDQLAEQDEHVGVVHFRRNFGKAAALDAGFQRVRGQLVFTMDADLQDDPKEIPNFLAKLDEGFDVVSGWKQIRNDPIDKTLPSKLFNKTVSRVSGLKLHDFNCGFKVYRREAIESLRLYGEMHRFVPVLVHWQGFRVGEMPVEHRARQFGKSKYGLSRLAKGFFDLMTVMLNTRYRARPLHLFGWVGSAIGVIGMAMLLYLVVLWCLDMGPIGNRPLLLFGALLVMVGIQFISIGLLGEMITRSQQSEKPAYVIRTDRRPRA